MTSSQPLASDTPGFIINRHYLCDLSVECPLGRVSDEDAPLIAQNQFIETATTPLSEPNQHLVEISVRLLASLRDQAIFVLDLAYRAEVALQHIPDDQVQIVLRQAVPSTLEEVVRKIIEQNGAFAGYPDMQLGDIDFSTAAAKVIADPAQ